MGLSREEALSSIRFSLSEETTATEIETAIETIVSVVKDITQTAALVA
jgi:cysteine sulfinate desulfinase/cysteine desulfurase-like protein